MNAPRSTPRYIPALEFSRTPAERRDPALAWARDDRRFFASGACHVLAFRAVERRVAPGLRVFFLQPEPGWPGAHAFASNERWALDFNGWTPHELLLRETSRAYRLAYPGRALACIALDCDLETFCRRYSHRRPDQFPRDPIRRADRWLERLGRQGRASQGRVVPTTDRGAG